MNGISIYSNVEIRKLAIIKDSFLSHRPYIQSSPSYQALKSFSELPLLLHSYCWLPSFFFSKFFITFLMSKTPAPFTDIPDFRQPLTTHSPQCPLKQLYMSILVDFQWIPIQNNIMWSFSTYLIPISYFYKFFIAAFMLQKYQTLCNSKYTRPPCLCGFDHLWCLVGNAYNPFKSWFKHSLLWFPKAVFVLPPPCPLHYPHTIVRALIA